MENVNLRGIVIRELPSGESGKRLLVFAKGYGKVYVVARGAKNPKSKFLAGTQLFSYCDFQTYKGKGFYAVTQIDIIENFYPIRSDIEKMAYASYLVELTDKVVMARAEEDQILELLIRALWLISKSEENISLLVRIFELKLLQLAGFMPQIDECVICGRKDSLSYFSVEEGGTVCADCACENLHFPISSGSIRAINYVLDSDMKRMFQFRVSESVLHELTLITRRYIYVHISTHIQSTKFIDSL